MLEARRRAYMSAMGIVQYAPIAQIDGAKASHLLRPEQVYPELNIDFNEEPEVVVEPVDSCRADTFSTATASHIMSEPAPVQEVTLLLDNQFNL